MDTKKSLPPIPPVHYICVPYVKKKRTDCITLTEKGPMQSGVCSSVTFHLLRHDELAVKSQTLQLLTGPGIVFASVVAATGGIKNCCLESLPILLQMRNQFSGPGGKIHILQCMERIAEEPRMRWRE